MLTMQDFLTAASNELANFPAVQELYNAGEPVVVAHMSAFASMLSLLSAQYEVAQAEPFEKTRPSTVLADAALKGIIPKARPALVSVTAVNSASSAFALAAGRVVLDSSGNPYSVETPVTVPANGSTTCTARQLRYRIIETTIALSAPFQRIEVTSPDDGWYISGFSVETDLKGGLTYQPEFTNVAVGDLVYHVETDEYRRTYVVFGAADIVGYQPVVGEIITITITETVGATAAPAAGSPFAWDYIAGPTDSYIKLSLAAILTPGGDPPDIPTLRELAKYPAVYAPGSLNRLDFEVRRAFPDLAFLSVWNEQIEESVRDPDVANINRLFVSCLPPTGGDQETTEAAILALIQRIDDSFRVSFVDAVPTDVEAEITAEVARVYDTAVVESQIIAALLAEYGATSTRARRGMLVPRKKEAGAILEAAVPALAGDGADYAIVFPAISGGLLPEQFRRMTAGSISVTVTVVDYGDGNFGY